MARVKDIGTVESVYTAALNLIHQKGYVSVKMVEVAKEAGIATGTIYNYFENKVDLVNKLYLKLKSEKMHILLRKVDQNDSLYGTMKKIWEAYIKESFSEYHKMLFIEQYTYSPLLNIETRSEAERMLEPIIQIFIISQQKDMLKPYDPEIMINMVMGGALEIVRYHINTGKTLTDKTIEETFEMAWSAIRK